MAKRNFPLIKSNDGDTAVIELKSGGPKKVRRPANVTRETFLKDFKEGKPLNPEKDSRPDKIAKYNSGPPRWVSIEFQPPKEAGSNRGALVIRSLDPSKPEEARLLKLNRNLQTYEVHLTAKAHSREDLLDYLRQVLKPTVKVELKGGG